MPQTVKGVIARSKGADVEVVDETAERIATLGVPPVGTPGALVAQRGWDDYSIGRAGAIEHLGDKISVDDLARASHMSRRSFIRTFRAATGTTPATWLRARRLDDRRGRGGRLDRQNRSVAGSRLGRLAGRRRP